MPVRSTGTLCGRNKSFECYCNSHHCALKWQARRKTSDVYKYGYQFDINDARGMYRFFSFASMYYISLLTYVHTLVSTVCYSLAILLRLLSFEYYVAFCCVITPCNLVDEHLPKKLGVHGVLTLKTVFILFVIYLTTLSVTGLHGIACYDER
jgi:hypothetical protein